MKREAYILSANSNLTNSTYLFKIIELTQTPRESLIQINLKKRARYLFRKINHEYNNEYIHVRAKSSSRNNLQFPSRFEKKTNLFNESTDLIQNTRISRRTREIGRNWNVPLPLSLSLRKREVSSGNSRVGKPRLVRGHVVAER